MYTYNQPTKMKARHLVIQNAVENLTLNRQSSAIVQRNYVRSVYDYFQSKEEISDTKKEIGEIDFKYIIDWEKLHDVKVKKKSPEELTVCYLCGPEPDNDFKEFTNLGILPQNIWAFENNKSCYDAALKTYEQGMYPQPRIIKQKIDSFFINTPKTFDIVYFDACSTLISEQHSLKSIRTLFQYNRLESIGVLITNFSAPDLSADNQELCKLIAFYLYFKKENAEQIKLNDKNICNIEYSQLLQQVKNNFDKYYSDFISYVIRDLGSVLVPIQKINTNTYFSKLFKKNADQVENYSSLFQQAKNNNLAKMIFSAKFLQDNDVHSKIFDLFFNDIGSLDDLFDCFKVLIKMQQGTINIDNSLKEITDYFESGQIYNFLDTVHRNMFFDIVLNQLTYPMHYNNKNNYRYNYIAKHNHMYMDLTVFDECRYIYEWLPAMHQIKSAFLNKSWQYVFRFALDGLVKSRKDYNNELFFQGTVISEREKQFSTAKIKSREKIGR